MLRDFKAELKARLDAIENRLSRKKTDDAPVIPVVRRFNIHKRSLPAGLDTVVVYNVTQLEAAYWIEKGLKARHILDDAQQPKGVVYFDAVPVDATYLERSIYFNAHAVLINENPR